MTYTHISYISTSICAPSRIRAYTNAALQGCSIGSLRCAFNHLPQIEIKNLLNLGRVCVFKCAIRKSMMTTNLAPLPTDDPHGVIRSRYHVGWRLPTVCVTRKRFTKMSPYIYIASLYCRTLWLYYGFCKKTITSFDVMRWTLFFWSHRIL